MRRIHTGRAPAVRVVLTVCTLLQMGCIGSSPPSRFYTLSSISSPGSLPDDTRYDAVVAVSTVNLPGHLDRPQIVAQTDPNSVVLAEFDRWAEPLRDNFTRILLRNLGDLLARESVLVTSWRGGMTSDYRLVVDAQRFDIEPDGVVLDATWVLLSEADEEVILSLRSVVREAIESDDDDYAARVVALSRTLGVLSRDIATGITETASESPRSSPCGACFPSPNRDPRRFRPLREATCRAIMSVKAISGSPDDAEHRSPPGGSETEPRVEHARSFPRRTREHAACRGDRGQAGTLARPLRRHSVS